jgi:hypothetical protein
MRAHANDAAHRDQVVKSSMRTQRLERRRHALRLTIWVGLRGECFDIDGTRRAQAFERLSALFGMHRMRFARTRAPIRSDCAAPTIDAVRKRSTKPLFHKPNGASDVDDSYAALITRTSSQARRAA